MAGINRLGRGPQKPGIQRPQDPNKYKTMNIFSEDTKGDHDYQRRVQEIEDSHSQNHMGWLFARGAFDKGDHLYLRDQEDKRRHEERELREAEQRAFAQARQRAEALRDSGPAPGAAPPQSESRTGGIGLPTLLKVKPTVKRKHEPGAADAKRVKSDPEQAARPVAVKAEEPEPAPDEGLAGLLGGYGSDSDEEPVAAEEAQRQPPVKRELPLPDILADGAVKPEPEPAEPPAPPQPDVAAEDGSDSESDDSD